MQMREFTMALKPRADGTRSPKQGHQWLHKKDLYPPNIFIRKRTLFEFLSEVPETNNKIKQQDFLPETNNKIKQQEFWSVRQ